MQTSFARVVRFVFLGHGVGRESLGHVEMIDYRGRILALHSPQMESSCQYRWSLIYNRVT